MTKMNEIYKCSICGNIVEMVETGAGTLVCCGKDMDLMEEKTEAQEGKEKHVPVVEEMGDDKHLIKVGSVPHPMEEGHYIQWIEVITPEKVIRKHLKPGEKPEKEFIIWSKDYTVREYCNVHGLWKK